MLDGVSLIASIITIAGVIGNGIECVKTCYRASEELRVLQEQVEQFALLARHIEHDTTRCHANSISTILSRAKTTLECLDRLVNIKLSKNVNGSVRARKRAWMRNRSKVYKILADLKEHRADLSAAANASNLACALRSEATLVSVGRDISLSGETTQSLDRRLALIHQIVSRTHDAVVSQSNSMSCSYNSHEGGPVRHLEVNKMAHLPGISSLLAVSHAVSRPASPFELSPNFLPETYAIDQRLPPYTFVLSRSHERFATVENRLNVYQLFFLKTSRVWCRLCVSLRIQCSSKYWKATELSGEDRSAEEWQFITGTFVGIAQLPRAILTQIQDCLVGLDAIEEDDSLAFEVMESGTVSLRSMRDINVFETDIVKSQRTTRELLNSLDDLKCPRYFEQQVTQMQMIDPPNRFVSCFKGRLVYEIKFTTSNPDPYSVYNIKSLLRLKEKAAFAELIGVVVDKAGKQLKSYLIDLPQSYLRFAPLTRAQGLSWKYREELAKQLVQAVVDVHTHGLVIGTKIGFAYPILIPKTNRIRFWDFNERFGLGIRDNHYYPPEFAYLSELSSPHGTFKAPKVTSKTDLFRLGMLLWALAENSPSSCCNPLCIRERCDLQTRPCLHVDPITLPELPASIPQYYKDIVNACRAESPEDRQPAWKLLTWFPTSDGLISSQYQASGDRPMPEFETTDPMSLGFKSLILCDQCRAIHIQFHFFHCNVCEGGNYDICPRCFHQSIHCLNNDHLLVEVKKTGIFAEIKGYHCSPGDSGQRDIVEL